MNETPEQREDRERRERCDRLGLEVRASIPAPLSPLTAAIAPGAGSITPESATITTPLQPLNEARYSEDQPRDEKGRFGTSMGGDWKGAKEHVPAKQEKEYKKLAEEHDKIYFAPEREALDEPARLASWQQPKLESLLGKIEASREKLGLKTDSLNVPRQILKDTKAVMTGLNPSPGDAVMGQDRALYLMHSSILSMGGHTKRASELLAELRAFRYSEDQPRDADGKFGSGGEGPGQVLFHGTLKESAEKIIDTGLKAGDTIRGHAAFATDDKRTALSERLQDAVEARKHLRQPCPACEGGDCFAHRPEFRYSEDQPRDDHGRFTSGGGEGLQDKTPEAAPPVFETPKVEAPLGMYHMTGRGTDAKMAVLPGGKHMLQAGSKIVLAKGASIPKVISAKRDELLANGTLLEREGYLITTQDIAFGSTSAAASFVLGTAASGPAEWKPEPGGKAIKSEEKKPAEEKRPSQDIWRPSGQPEPPGTGEPSFPRIMHYENTRLVDRTTKALKELPATHLDALSEVHFRGGGVMTVDAPQGRVTNAIGFYNHGTNAVTIADYYGHASLGHLNDTLWHEVGHHVHMQKLTTDAAREWAALSKDGSTAKVSSYARTNTAEHFAEAYAAYKEGQTGSGRGLKFAEPKVHDFMARVFDPSSGMLKGNGRKVSTWSGNMRLHGAE